jgi:hypothetical protein
MGEQKELMERLLNFYKARYNGKELENKFNDACEDLINTGDIKRATYIEFCISNEVEPKIRKIAPKSSSSSSSSGNYYDDGCGSRGIRSRSSC